jgi:hypothetical protein
MNPNTTNHEDLELLRSAILHQADNWAWATRQYNAVKAGKAGHGGGYPLEDWERTLRAAEVGLAEAVDAYAKAFNKYEGRAV